MNGRLHARGVLPLVLALVTALLYLPVLGHEFVSYDDPVFVYENPHVSEGLTAAGARWAFGIHGPSQYHPLTWLSHMLDVELFGLEPAGHHAVNVTIHIASTLLLYWLLVAGTGATWRSAAVAALFGWHPTRVESVAWVAERKDLLCALFVLATVAAYGWYARKPGIARYVVVLTAFALALLSKPMAVTLPALLLLVDWWPLDRLRRATALKLALEKVPLLMLAIGAAVISYLCQVEAAAVASLDEMSLAARLANAVVSCARYLRMTMLPTHLAVFYPRQAWEVWQVVGAALVLAAVTSAVVISRRRFAVVGWAWFLLALVPVIGILQVGDQAMADRYTYLPLIGVFVAVVWAVGEGVERRRAVRAPVVLAAATLFTGYALTTAWQVTRWRDTVTLMSHAAAVTEKNVIAHYTLGLELAKRGRIAEAAKHYAEAVRAAPDYLDAQVNLGAALEVLGDHAGAERHYRAALAVNPNDADARANLEALLARRAGSATTKPVGLLG